MQLSFQLPHARLVAFLLANFFMFSIASAQNHASQEVYTPTSNPFTHDCKRSFSIYVTPTKYAGGEMPIMLAKQVSNALVVEAGAGPVFRDRVAEQLFNGNTLQKLEFLNPNATYKMGYGIYAGLRYLTACDPFAGFYIHPELAYLHRDVVYPVANVASDRSYDGDETSLNIRVLLGYDRLISSYSKHLFYGGYFGFGMRRYAADYFVVSNADPGTRTSVEMIPTMHLGYRIGWTF